MILKKYLKSRLSNPSIHYDVSMAREIIKQSKGKLNMKHPLIISDNDNLFDNKGVSDQYAIDIWNSIHTSKFHISRLDDLKPTSSRVLRYYDSKYPYGKGMSERDIVRYVTAHSSSSFIGIQNPRKSTHAMDSMIKSLKSHARQDLHPLEWVVDNLNPYIKISNDLDYMNTTYGDLCLTAKTSSSSIKGLGSFRDFVYTHTLDEIVSNLVNVPCYIYIGTRSDRRGKFRSIFSFDGHYRAIDYMMNHGTYRICDPGGILSQYTTEGLNSKQMWEEMAAMSDRSGDTSMACTDYVGYDQQISIDTYVNICEAFNLYRRSSLERFWDWYFSYTYQPKPVVTRSSEAINVLLPDLRTLPSGLNGTHSHQNLIGISTMLQAGREGVRVLKFKSNGDDQNSRIRNCDIDNYVKFIGNYFKVSWDKSLIGHDLSVWGKLWFTRNYYPMPEIGTIRSIWEREGGSVNYVENSKFQSNYCKILQLSMLYLRLGYDETYIRSWINKLCDVCGILPNRIPVKLSSLKSTKSGSVNDIEPKGLISVKSELMSKTFNLSSLNVNNYYDMLRSNYSNNTFYNLDIENVEYYEEGEIFRLTRGIDYSYNPPSDIPWVYKRLFIIETLSPKDSFNRDVIQGTKSFEGMSSYTYLYHDMFTLAIALNERNISKWRYLTQNYKAS